MSFQAPVKDLLFNIEHLARIDQVAKLPGFEEAGLETAQAVLEECAKFNEGVVAPLNVAGDKQPATFADGKVTTTPGFKEAYRQFTEGGWQGVQHPEAYGGQGLPKTIAAACAEILHSANMSFALCPMLTDGAIEALLIAGCEKLKSTYLEKLVSGQWTGTMNLTEPQAGSDLALIRSRAERQADGTYKVFGTKIFITYGEHDMAENLVHLVLARLPDAPEGVKGISLFIVPKFLVNADGSLGQRNDVHCVSIEHKLGIKGSPTAVLQFGDHGGAVGYLVGESGIISAIRSVATPFGVCLPAQAAALAALEAIADGTARGVEGGEPIILVANDHEEVGSQTRSGAGGPFLETVLGRLAGVLGINGDARAAMLARSICVSADAGHAVHPGHPQLHDPAVRPALNRGPLVKINAQQRYATDAVGTAVWLRACAAADVPVQDFVSNNTVPCGTTIGPITAARLGITTVDIGQPLLSMHSQREMCGVADGLWMARAMRAFWLGA